MPKGLHRIRYGGFLTSSVRGKNLARIRPLMREWNEANRDKLHPALLNDTYNAIDKDIQNPEDVPEEKFDTNPAPACLVCGAGNMRHLEYRDGPTTLADIQRMKDHIDSFSTWHTTLDYTCEQINKEAKRSRTLAGKFVQPTFAEHEYAKRWASVYSVVRSTRFDPSIETSLKPMTMNAISCVETEANAHVNSDDEPGCSGMRQAFRSAPTKTLTVSATDSQKPTFSNPSTTEFAIGQLVQVIGQVALLSTLMDSTIDTLDGIVQSIASNIHKPTSTQLFRFQLIAQAMMERWAECVDHRTVQLASQFDATWTRSTTSDHRNATSIQRQNLPLPEW